MESKLERENARIKVVCAIIQYKDKTLVVQRSENMSLPLKWEFPGGKIEANESEIDCIKREIKEELDIEIKVVKRLNSSNFDYPTFSIELIPYTAEYISGDLKLREHQNYKWAKKEELLDLDWAEADVPIVKEFIAL